MLFRLIYSCIKTYRYRRQLANYLVDPKLHAVSVVNLEPAELAERGIKALVLDFDGVLAAYAKDEPLIVVQRWLRNCSQYFGPNKIFVLSNKPTIKRKQYFAKNFPGLTFVIPKHKKPFPNSLKQIILATKLSPNEILMVDDRLLTGILAAELSSVQGCLIKNPFIDLKEHPIRENLFVVARKFEQYLCKWLN